MLLITYDAQESVLYAFDLSRHDLPVYRMLRASVGDERPLGFVYAAPSARWGDTLVVVWKETLRLFRY